MIVDIQRDIDYLNGLGLLNPLLKDWTTKKNITWATDAYSDRGEEYRNDKRITPALITGRNADIIKCRAVKATDAQSERTKKRAEVFTPFFICKKMNDYADSVWFGRKDGINKLIDGKIAFKKSKKWQSYVDARRLEITCGEAPFIVSRYDAATGEMIEIPERTGLLDRKLRVVNENAKDAAEWKKWARRAVQSVYGYEFQGDNLLIARVNVAFTYIEFYKARFGTESDKKELAEVIKAVAYNFFQMDGLTGRLPFGTLGMIKGEQVDMFSILENRKDAPLEPKMPACRVHDWKGHTYHEFTKVKEGEHPMKFENFLLTLIQTHVTLRWSQKVSNLKPRSQMKKDILRLLPERLNRRMLSFML